MIKVKQDVTKEYYNMLESFMRNNYIKIREIQNGRIYYDRSFFEIEKELIKNNNEEFIKYIELLEKLEFGLRNEYLKIVVIDRDSLENKGDE